MNPCSAFAYFPFIFWLVFGLAGMSARGNEPPRKFFRDYKCYYELPDASWSWNNQPGSHILFAAKNSKGMFVTLQWFQLKQVQTLEQYVPVYEENYFKSGQFRKRGGRFLSFRGSPCYQLEASLSDGRTVVTRIFLNNYLVALQLTVIGGPEPIERTPEFESVVQGLYLMDPPKPWWEKTLMFVFVGAICLFLLVVFVVIRLRPWAWDGFS